MRSSFVLPRPLRFAAGCACLASGALAADSDNDAIVIPEPTETAAAAPAATPDKGVFKLGTVTVYGDTTLDYRLGKLVWPDAASVLAASDGELGFAAMKGAPGT